MTTSTGDAEPDELGYCGPDCGTLRQFARNYRRGLSECPRCAAAMRAYKRAHFRTDREAPRRVDPAVAWRAYDPDCTAAVIRAELAHARRRTARPRGHR